MEIALPKGLADFVREQIDSGLYESPDEVYRDGLRLLKERRDGEALKLERLRRELTVGLEQLDRGEGLPFDVQDIIALGKQKRQA
ncbi:MAG: type II toxin-antitoxin system ParD family antitoxin [Candidatus Hydrogenedentes bacterium]|nr:type II toxin-antitoxin system ParD family antitoxin [Candidatus Hydrogenedentota bacterium]